MLEFEKYLTVQMAIDSLQNYDFDENWCEKVPLQW